MRRPWSIGESRRRRRSRPARRPADAPSPFRIITTVREPLDRNGEPTMKRWMYLLLAAGFIGASILSSAQQSAPAPDTILFNGKVITVDDQFSIAQAVAVRGDRIVAVGTNQNIQRLAGPNTRRIDLRGRSVVPGLIDNHAHFQEEGAYWTLELRFDGVDTRKQALEMIRAKAQAAGPGKWVFNLC